MRLKLKLKPKLRKEDSIIITFAAILVVIVSSLIFLSLKPFVSPEPTPVQPTSYPTPTPLTRSPESTSFFNQDALKKLKHKSYSQTKTPLNETDARAKEKLIAQLNGKVSGFVYRSPTVRVEYVTPLDMLYAEVTTINVIAAKEEATKWLFAQGFSQEGVCNFPVMFYPHWEIAEQLRKLGAIFNPLAPGC